MNNLFRDFKNAFRIPDNLRDLDVQKKWAEHQIKELSLIIKVFIAFIYDSSILSDSSQLFEDILGKNNLK